MTDSEMRDYNWLVSEEATSWLEQAAAAPQISASLIKRLRQDLGTSRARLVCEQAELRVRAAAKFSRANQMFFTSKGLEQSTGEVLSRYKATRCQPQLVADGCCGIGGDLIGIGAAGTAHGIESDPVTALFAQANLHCYQGRGQVTSQSVESFRIEEVDRWHLDPDRRVGGARTTTVDLFSPGVDLIDDWLERLPSGCIKLAPATKPPAEWSEKGQIEFVGSGRECQQQLIWFGEDAADKPLAATVVRDADYAQLCQTQGTVPVAKQPQRFVFAPHAVVRAGRLVDSLGLTEQLQRLSNQCSYLTGDSVIASPFVAAFEVLATLPFDRRKIKQCLRQHDIGRLEVKKSGVDVDPNALQKKWSSKQGHEGVVLLYSKASNVEAVVGRRVNV